MDWQQVVALAIVGITALVFLWSRVRRRKRGLGKGALCGEGQCGCAGTTSPSARESVVFRARKGERPQVIVKMK